ncbi:MAG TPA: hypothetical protein VGH28_15800 [Polyangiaceae bacterium]|jgi:hypothetical protein
MRTIVLLFLASLGCHGSADTADAAPVTPKAVAVDSAEDEPEPPPDAASDAGETATLRDLDGGPAQTAKVGGTLLCKIHSVWHPPDGFAVTALHDSVVARKDQELVAIVFRPHTADSYARASAAFVDGQLAWDAPAMNRIDEWHAESTTHGRANGMVVATRTLYAGVDPKTGAGRPGSTDDVLWLAIAKSEARADALLAEAKTQTKMLVDHACECGYDCSKRH